MTVSKAALFMIKKCVLQPKRSIFYAATRNIDNQQMYLTEHNEDPQLRQKNKRLLKIAMLGLPNAGKSTLVNKLIHRSVCPTSSKVHTTMHKAEAIYTEGNTQLVFMDTPGITTSKEIKTYELLSTFKEDPKVSIKAADVIGIIQDVTNIYTRHKFDKFFLEYIENKREDVRLLLIFNKVDRLKKKIALLELTRTIMNKENYPKFDDIFMVSALTGDGVDDLRNYLLGSAKEKEWIYEENIYTDQPIEKIIEQTVRAQLMDILPHEMPYKVKIITEDFGFRNDGSVHTVVILDCPKQSYVRVLLKHKAFKVKCLAFHVEKELRHAFRNPVFVRLSVTCSKELSDQ